MDVVDVAKLGFTSLNITFNIVIFALYVVASVLKNHKLKFILYWVTVILASIVKVLQYIAIIFAIRHEKFVITVTDIILLYLTHIILFNSAINLAYMKDNGAYNIENSNKPGKKPSEFLDLLYYTFVTSFTIGYGDISPHNVASKLIFLIHSIDSYILFVFFISMFTKMLTDVPFIFNYSPKSSV